MAWLVVGVLLWMAAHLSVTAARGVRGNFISKMGIGPYKGVFALVIVASIVLMVIGWRSTAAETVYEPPEWGALAAAALMPIAFVLFAVAQGKSNIRRFIRHPMLTGMMVWGVAHLLANGDIRSVILFGGMVLWAALEIPIINNRLGDWQKPEKSTFMADLRPVAIALVIYVIAVFAHPYVIGVSASPH